MSTQQDLITKIGFFQKMLDIARKILRIQTQLERLRLIEITRRIAKEEGLTQCWEDILVATIDCESGFRPRAKNKNKDGSCDWGLCQWNDGPQGVASKDKWWIGEGKLFSSVEEVLSNPEKNIRMMIKVHRSYPNGLNNWICYKNKKYISHLTIQ